MKTLFITSLIVTILLCSCKKEKKEQIEKNVTIHLNLRSGDYTCAEECGSTISIVNSEWNNLKSKYALPDSITSKWEYWNREYIANIKFYNDTCHCKNTFYEPTPPGSTNYPTEHLQMIEILKIREK
ncbi:MAG: hypothetical protein BGO32_01550 [Bacteroidetes bacterium 37-13]|nr:MAG: hypothetical protein BGO32_01550 [Bacteroidetes bacterium 37-13]